MLKFDQLPAPVQQAIDGCHKPSLTAADAFCAFCVENNLIAWDDTLWSLLEALLVEKRMPTAIVCALKAFAISGEEIATMAPQEAFELYCHWHGLIGYSEILIGAFVSLKVAGAEDDFARERQEARQRAVRKLQYEKAQLRATACLRELACA
ncbi:hypothetical protein BX589_10164 [Paraburkholderia fungorum]|jgi:hypothetical protein|uniref:hypothetical protein n=1 Tax=Paraburkholderia fungorum TaxID=134537 RepID=UPI000D07FEAE|nr:hypothetical protein [Paraburkholderia fungorum]PRZ56414.1 hypothetical protein BX589_10164 [Paraburkholderia fungorum]